MLLKSNLIKSLFIFYMGSIFGSFAGVIIERRPVNLNYISDRSRCMSCNKIIPFYLNIPIFSYIMLIGRCHFCKEKISLKHLIYEIFGGCILLYSYFRYSFTLNFILYSLILYLILIISFTDINEYNIYSSDLVTLFVLILIFKLYSKSFKLSNIIYALLFSIIFFLIWFITASMGEGDIILSFITGLTFNSLKEVYMYFQIIFIIAAFVSVFLVLFKIKSRKDFIAFGPFILIPLLII